MTKIVRKIVTALASREDRDSRHSGVRLFASALETERANLENIGRAWRMK